MFSTLSVFLDFNLPNATTWFYFSLLLAVALFFKFGRLLSIRNGNVIMLFLLVPGLLVLHGTRPGVGPAVEHPSVQAVALIGQSALPCDPLAVTVRVGAFAQQPHAAFEAARWQWFGYLWLICGSVYLFCRCLFDLALVQRPALSANLSFGGLAWLAAALLICLIAVAFRPPSERPIAPLAQASPGTLAALSPPQGPAEFVLQQLFEPPGWVFRLFAILCHVAILVGLVVIGWRHFGDASAGMAAATFYLMLPYTGLYVGQADQAWPAALVVWAVAVYRHPILAGTLLGLATGTAFFPLVLLPVWTSFYSGRGTGRFLSAWLLTLGLCLANLGVILSEAETLPPALHDGLLAWLPWRMPATEGFWTGIHAAYRLPVFIAYLAFILGTTVWPSPKNLAQVMALSAAALIGLQLWYADQGGIYVLWYAPLMLLLAFRPNLQDHRPPPINSATDWLAGAVTGLSAHCAGLPGFPSPPNSTVVESTQTSEVSMTSEVLGKPPFPFAPPSVNSPRFPPPRSSLAVSRLALAISRIDPMPRFVPFVGALVIVALLVAGPCWYKLDYDQHYRNFHVVDPGVLYRSAELDLDGLKHVVREYGIRTIVDLRDGETALDRSEADWATSIGLNHVRIPPRSWWAVGGPAPAEIGLAEFRRVMRDPAQRPVLVHCFGGIHRTGIYCAIYRMDFQHWNRLDAMAEMRTMGYTILDEHQDVLAFLLNHRPPAP